MKYLIYGGSLHTRAPIIADAVDTELLEERAEELEMAIVNY